MDLQERIEELQIQRLDLNCMMLKLKQKNQAGEVTLSFQNMTVTVRKKVAIRLLKNSINSIDTRIGRMQETLDFESILTKTYKHEQNNVHFKAYRLCMLRAKCDISN